MPAACLAFLLAGTQASAVTAPQGLAAFETKVAGFVAEAQSLSPADRPARDAADRLGRAARVLAGVRDAEGLRAWGRAFFKEAYSALDAEALTPLAGRVQALEAHWRELTAAWSLPARAAPDLAFGLKEPSPPRSSLQTDGAGLAIPGARPGLGARRGALVALTGASDQVEALPETAAERGLALIEALLKPKGAAPVRLQYRLDEEGRILSVKAPETDYEESREFEGGLLARKTIRQGDRRSGYVYRHDAKGRLERKHVSNFGPSGYEGGASLVLDPRTGRPLRGWEFDAQGRPSPIAFDSKGAPLGQAGRAVASAPMAHLLVDWQVASQEQLEIVKDTREKDHHNPFWGKELPKVRRGFTDPDDPKAWKRHPIHGDRRAHTGIDLPMASGTPVYPTKRGRVLRAGWMGGYGYAVLVQHFRDNRPDGEPAEVTLYGHLSKILVKRGQWVLPGRSILGKVGSTGNSTGPHLHFEVRKDGSFEDPMDELSPSQPDPKGRVRLSPQLAGL